MSLYYRLSKIKAQWNLIVQQGLLHLNYQISAQYNIENHQPFRKTDLMMEHRLAELRETGAGLAFCITYNAG